MLNTWFSATMLAFESAHVVNLRVMKIAGGGSAAWHETHLMMTEKVGAALESVLGLAAGGTVTSSIERYREHVAANAIRLAA